MTVTLAQLQADLGEIYDGMNNGTTAVSAIITRAESFVELVESTKPDSIVRPLAAAMCVNQVIGGIDGVNKTIGTLSVGNKDLRTMQSFFKHEANKAAVIAGVSLDGMTLIFKDTAS